MIRNILLIALGATFLSRMPVSAQTLLPGTHSLDSLMWRLEYRFGQKKAVSTGFQTVNTSLQPWVKMNTPDSLQSVIVKQPDRAMMIDPNASRFTMTMTYHPQSVFSHKDDLMFYKDYGWGNFVSDILFGW